MNKSELIYVDLDAGKSLAEIDSDRLVDEASNLAEQQRLYEKYRDEIQALAARGSIRSFCGDYVTSGPIRPLKGKHTSSHKDRNRIDLGLEGGIANANHPVDDPSLRY